MKFNQRIHTIHRICLAAALTTVWHAPVNAQSASVPLGTADSFAVLAGSGITVAGAANSTTINGNIGTFPTTTITGLGNVVLNGVNHAGDLVTQQAKNDLLTAYNDAAGRAPTGTIVSGLLGGQNLVPGVYADGGFSFGLTGTVTLNAQGNSNAVWIFQTGSTLITASNSSVVIINGGQACKVFWQVGSSATLGTGTNFQGNILALTDITANTGTTVLGRLLARNGAVTLDTNTIAAAICQQVVNGTGNGGANNNAASVAELKKALILSAQVVDSFSAQGLTSIYSLGFAQFDSEVFSLQQRFADIRAGSGSSGAPDVYSPNPNGTEIR